MLVERQTPQRMGPIAANEPLAFVDMPGRRNLPGLFQIVIERPRILFVKPRRFAGIELQRTRFLPSGRASHSCVATISIMNRSTHGLPERFVCFYAAIKQPAPGTSLLDLTVR
jgi:hypothetical protein